MKAELVDTSKDILQAIERNSEDWVWFAGGLILGACCCSESRCGMVLFGTSLGVAGIAAGLHLQDERLLMGGAGIFAGMILAGGVSLISKNK